jgi:hypothetical protein
VVYLTTILLAQVVLRKMFGTKREAMEKMV